MSSIDDVTIAFGLLVVLSVLLIICYSKKVQINKDGFGIDNRPMEHENSLLMRNPWDEVDYIVPTFVKTAAPPSPIY
jgi:hypothetical protein